MSAFERSSVPASSQFHLSVPVPRSLCLAILFGLQSMCTWTPHAAAQTRSAGVYRFQIPSGPLSQTLRQFAKETGILLSSDASLMDGKSSQGLKATGVTIEQGLQQLLAGTGLQAQRQTSGNYILHPVRTDAPNSGPSVGGTTLDTVTVVANALSSISETPTGPVAGYVAKRSITGTKTDTPLIEIPQSISVVTADEIGDRKAESLDEVLRYTAGVTPNQRPLGSDDSSMLRGFTIETTGILLDGLRNSGRTFASSIEPYGLERLEVLRGPSSVLYGQVAPGGMVNAVSKRPSADSIRELGVEYGSYNRRTLKADVGGPIDKAGQWSYRLTMLGRESGTRLDHDSDNRLYIAPALTWKPNADTRLTLLARYQKDNQQYGFPNQLETPGAQGQVNPSVNLSGYDNRFRRSNRMLGLDFEHRFSDTWMFRQNLRYSSLKNERTDLFPAALVGGSIVERYFWPVNTTSQSLFSDTQLQANFTTGPIAHTAVVGMDYTNIRNTDRYPYEIGFVPSLDLYNPVYSRLPLVPAADPSREHSPSRQLGLYAQDQLKWNRWVLTAGIRHDRVRQSSTTTDLNSGVSTTGYDQSPSATTGRVGAVYLFESGLAPYVSYATSFAPELGNSVTGAPLIPSRGKQLEAGLRYQPAGQRSMYTASVFDLRRENVTSAVIGNPGKVNQTGEISVRGLELEARTELTSRLSVVAQYTYLSTNITRSNNGDQGLAQRGAPKHSASIWSKYSFPVGDSFRAYTALGVRYLGKMRSNSDGDNQNLINPSMALWDAALGLERGPWRVALNINNIFNQQKLFDCGYLQGVCYRSAERTVNLSASYLF